MRVTPYSTKILWIMICCTIESIPRRYHGAVVLPFSSE